MHFFAKSTSGIVILLASFTSARKVTNPSKVPRNAMLLSNVASLTLRADKLTSSRRVKPLQQLECVGPDYVCALYKVDVMRCKNEGADYDAENIQWSCKASLPEEFKLGSTDVICEGYESSDDPYVLKGSCGVEYRLLLTEKGSQKYGTGHHHSHEDGWTNSRPDKSSWLGGFVFAALFAVVLFVILRGIYQSLGNGRPERRTRYRRNGGGTDDDNDPPPPYDGPPAFQQAPRKKHTNTSSSSSRQSPSQARSQPRQDSWRPGFWTGAATGAAAGYATNRYFNQSQAQQQNESAQTSFGNMHAPSSSSDSRSTPSHSSERHESTGFGGTRRR